jgi:hypothetical protein
MSLRPYGAWVLGTLRDAGWAPALVFALHVVASRGFHVYDRFPLFDVPMHFLGGAAMAYFFHTAALNGARLRVLGPYQRLSHLALVFAWVCTVAVCWEFAEWITDHYFGTHAQMGDLDDTLKDILVGMVGGSVLLAAFVATGRIPPNAEGGGAGAA